MDRLLLNSLPKSGSHLLIKLINLMGYSFLDGANFSSTSLYGRKKLPKYLVRGLLFGGSCVEVGLDIAACVRTGWIENKLGNMREGQYCTGHLPYSDCMMNLLTENAVKPIHILRDPRDVLVSWAHYVPKRDYHYGRFGLEGCSLDERVLKILHGFRSGRFRIESFSNILERSWKWAEKDDVLVVRFENLVGPEGGGDLEIQHRTIRTIAMTVGKDHVDIAKISGELFGGTNFFRKGKIGAWRDELSATVIAEINGVLEKMISQMGYKR